MYKEFQFVCLFSVVYSTQAHANCTLQALQSRSRRRLFRFPFATADAANRHRRLRCTREKSNGVRAKLSASMHLPADRPEREQQYRGGQFVYKWKYHLLFYLSLSLPVSSFCCFYCHAPRIAVRVVWRTHFPDE